MLCGGSWCVEEDSGCAKGVNLKLEGVEVRESKAGVAQQQQTKPSGSQREHRALDVALLQAHAT